MCTFVSARSAQIWLVGPSISSVYFDQISVDHEHTVEKVLPEVKIAPDWNVFLRTAPLKPALCRSRLVVVADISVLTHRDIAQLRSLRERYNWLSAAVFFDKPDLGKVIHAFNSDLAAYGAIDDNVEEIRKMIELITAGSTFYTTGFCNLLRHYGFPIEETHYQNR